MLEKLLKELGEQGYDISWRYEVMTNSIVVRVEKKVENIPFAYSAMIKFSEIKFVSESKDAEFEFFMTQIVRDLARSVEQAYAVKGENHE